MRTTFVAALAVMGWAMGPAALAQVAETGASQELSLQDAVRQALAASPLLKARQAAVDAGSASIRQADIRPNPELGLEVENFTGTGPFTDFGSTEATLTYSQKIERGGKRDARIRLAQSERTLSLAEKSRSAADVALATQRAWIAVAAWNRSVAVAEDRVRLSGELAEIARRRVEAARDPLSAKLKAENKVAAAQADLVEARRMLEAAREELGALLDHAALPRVPGQAIRRLHGAGAQGDSPDLAVREAAIARASRSFELEKARAKQDPTVGVGVRYFGDRDEAAALVSFSMPIALFDTNRGNIDRAMAQRQEAEWMLAEERRRRAASIRQAQAKADAARAQAAALRDDMIPRAEEAARSAQDGYDRGAFDYLDVADAQEALIDLRVREVEALRNLHEAQAAIDRLTGRWLTAEEQ
jgi:cobalt-zinc-cadmium efflux system outer membrane protein